jgi:hypothetical protein
MWIFVFLLGIDFVNMVIKMKIFFQTIHDCFPINNFGIFKPSKHEKARVQKYEEWGEFGKNLSHQHKGLYVR